MDRFFTFVGGSAGPWKVTTKTDVAGDGLPAVDRLDIVSSAQPFVPELAAVTWCLRGVVSNERYVTRSEKAALMAVQPPLGRAEASCAAFIALSKSPEWWGLTQDERRAILETQSRHIATGLNYLPAVARRLHHSRDLGGAFDFLTWFEFAPSDAAAFDQLVGELRRTEEWKYVIRECDLRLIRSSDS
ncbi:chlorite dismutase [bacterium]|nr:chlorite dismutase [bacterium]